MSFVEFLVLKKGFLAYRKIYNAKSKKWEYIQVKDNLNYFSSMVPGFIDIRLIKDNLEIIVGIPGVFIPDNADNGKTHHPTLIWPKLGTLKEIDKLFEELPHERIFEIIEKNK